VTQKYSVNRVEFDLCDACLDAIGDECHTPGCILFLSRAPDLAIRDKIVLRGGFIRPWVAEPKKKEETMGDERTSKKPAAATENTCQPELPATHPTLLKARIERLEKHLNATVATINTLHSDLKRSLEYAEEIIAGWSEMRKRVKALERKLGDHRHSFRRTDLTGDFIGFDKTDTPILEPPEPEPGAEKATEPKA